MDKTNWGPCRICGRLHYTALRCPVEWRPDFAIVYAGTRTPVMALQWGAVVDGERIANVTFVDEQGRGFWTYEKDCGCLRYKGEDCPGAELCEVQ